MMGRFGAASALAQLAESKQEIEHELGFPLVWNPNPDASDKVIGVFRDADLGRRDKWPEYLNWLASSVVRMKEVFGPRVKGLVLTTGDAPGEST